MHVFFWIVVLTVYAHCPSGSRSTCYLVTNDASPCLPWGTEDRLFRFKRETWRQIPMHFCFWIVTFIFSTPSPSCFWSMCFLSKVLNDSAVPGGLGAVLRCFICALIICGSWCTDYVQVCPMRMLGEQYCWVHNTMCAYKTNLSRNHIIFSCQTFYTWYRSLALLWLLVHMDMFRCSDQSYTGRVRSQLCLDFYAYLPGSKHSFFAFHLDFITLAFIRILNLTKL